MSATDVGGFEPPRELVTAIRDSGLVEAGSSGVLLLSGGPDSIALLAGLAGVELSGLVVLHLNYGLRPESGSDQAVCESACGRLGVELVVREAGEPEGNTQDWARRLRYEAAEVLRAGRNAEWIATGHTESDVAETVIYRLASSPGRRSLAAMKPRNGAVVRPLIGLTRDQTRALADESGLGFADDSSNEDPAFARVRIRREVLPVLEQINPAATANISLTRTELAEEGELLEGLANQALDEALVAGRLAVADLEDRHPALRRLMIRALAERVTKEMIPVPADVAAEAMRLAADPEGGLLDLGGGHRLRMESGTISVEDRDPVGSGDGDGDGVQITPGVAASWRGWTLEVTLLDAPFAITGAEEATLDREDLSAALTVRGWLPGDRIQPLGMKGSKTLQDLFTDAGVPRSERARIPVFTSASEIVWVAGLAVSHRHRLRPGTSAAIRLRAVRAEPI